MKACLICGKPCRNRQKTCSDACRQTLSRRGKDAQSQAYDIGAKLDKLSQGYNTGAIDHEQARAIVSYIERRLDKLRISVEAEQLRRLMEQHK